MTSPPENSSARRTTTRRLLIAAALALGGSAWAGACSTTETTAFSDGSEGDCVAGGCAQGASSSSTSASSGSSSSGAMCAVDAGCAVTWGADIFTKIIASSTSNCAGSGTGITMSCHGDGKGMLTLSATDAHASYLALKDWKIMNAPDKGKSYIVPCDKAGSGMLCNLNVDDGDGGVGTNPFGACGSAMPLFGTNLTMAQLNQIADWIACGAPEN